MLQTCLTSAGSQHSSPAKSGHCSLKLPFSKQQEQSKPETTIMKDVGNDIQSIVGMAAAILQPFALGTNPSLARADFGKLQLPKTEAKQEAKEKRLQDDLNMRISRGMRAMHMQLGLENKPKQEQPLQLAANVQRQGRDEA